MKGKTFSIVLIVLLFTLIGSAYAADIDNVSTDNLNLNQDINSISLKNLEVSSNDSISETNSHEDNIDSYMKVAIPVNTTLVTNNITLYKSNGTRLVTTLFGENNTPIAGQNISFLINGVSYNRVTNVNGTAGMAINLPAGNYTVKTIFKGSDEYAASEVNSTITVLSTLSANNVVKYFKNGTQFYATLLNGAGELYEGATITFNIHGVFYERKTNVNGTAKLNINLAPGTYIITSMAPNGEMVSNNVTVLSIINGSDVVKYYRNGTQYYAQLLNDNGEPYVNATVTFNIHGLFYERRTNANGTAKLNINLAQGSYIITAIAPNGQMTSNNITVLSNIITHNLTKYYLDSQTFNIILLNSTGGYSTNATATCNIGGQIYTVTTGSDGVGRLPVTLTPDTYTVTVWYNEESVSNSITVNTANLNIIGSNIQASALMNVSYTVGLTYPNGEVVPNQTVVFKILNETFNATTDNTGNATAELGQLPIGEHLINYIFPGYGGLMPVNGTSIIKIVNSTSLINAKDLYMTYGQTGKFIVTLSDLNLTPIVNKTITFTVNGVDYNRTTNGSGMASLTIKLPPGNYTIQYSYSKPTEEDYAVGTNNILVAKQPAYLIGYDLTVNYGEPINFVVDALTTEKKIINNSHIKVTVNGKEYEGVLNSTGSAVVSLDLPVGVYNASYTFSDDSYYVGKVVNSSITVKGYKLTGNDITISKNTPTNFDVLLTDENDKPVVGKTINFNILENTYESITNEEGIASVTVPGLESNTVIYYSTDSNKYTGQNTISVHGSVSIQSIIQASVNLKTFIENNYLVPETVDIDGVTYTSAQFLYLVSKATVSMTNGVFEGDIQVIDVANPADPSSSTVTGNLNDYKSLAEVVITFIESNGIAPNSMQTAIGDSGYYPIIYALARTVAFYQTNGILPAYVSLRVISNVIPSSPLDDPNTIKDLAPYLAATKNCQVNNAEIQALAAKLTDGLTNEWAKAQAIYNYVRDSVSYSFYYNSRYGAYNTLFSSHTANCCDQASALIALFRAAGLPARYVHGTCTFSSGSTYGHVWAQVLIGDTWVVADPTSTRNSLGIVNNWNNYHYSLKGHYAELSF